MDGIPCLFRALISLIRALMSNVLLTVNDASNISAYISYEL